MELFSSTLNQIAFLFCFIITGYGLMKGRLLPENSSAVLSKLENMLFVPALVLGTFMKNFTVECISSAWKLLVISSGIGLIAIVFAILASRVVTRDSYIRKIYTYGLSFSNFGFMGNAVVSSLFPDIFLEYLIFTLPLWTFIYMWGVPTLLIADSGKKQTIRESLRAFCNPMFGAMLAGMIIGISGIELPSWITSFVDISGSCMSPVAMLLTGVVVSAIPLRQTFSDIRTIIISLIRLLVMPLIFMVIASLLPVETNGQTWYICALCSLAMPLGLNTIVIPSSLGRDTTVAASMAIISHLLSAVTIPLIFMIAK